MVQWLLLNGRILIRNLRDIGENKVLTHAKCLAGFLTALLCNKGSGVCKHFGKLALLVTPRNSRRKIKYNVFLVNSFGTHFNNRAIQMGQNHDDLNQLQVIMQHCRII